MKKGFTLIELLAVIVILAVIALIATPMILNVIETSKVGAAESSVLGYVEAIENKVMLDTLKGISTKDGIYEVGDKEVQIKGNAPSEGWYKIEKGQVIDYSLKIGDYIIDYDILNKKIETTKNGSISPKPDAKVAQLTNDVNNNGQADIGDEITVGTESFYVISNDGEKVSMLAKYNLYVGGIYDGTTSSWTAFKDEATGLQDENMLGNYYGISQYDKRYGTTIFSSTLQKGTKYTDYTGSIVEKYVNNYVDILNNTYSGLNATGSLITIEQLQALGCVLSQNTCTCSEAPSWIGETTYWTGSAADYDTNYYIWYVSHSKHVGFYVYYHDISCGVRPVIIISESTIY